MHIYFDKHLIKKEYISFLAPLLGCPDFPIWREDNTQIKDWSVVGKDLLSVSSKQDCDYFVYPKYFALEYSREVKEYANDAKKHGKKVLVFCYGEIDDYIDISDNIVWYKRSTHRNNPSNELCLPPFPQDIFSYNDNTIPFIKPAEKYSIGYTGYSDYFDLKSFFRYLFVRRVGLFFGTKPLKFLLMLCKKEDLYATLVNAGIGNYCRGQTVKQLKKTKKYLFNFIQRKHALTVNLKTSMREELIHNLIHSDFALLTRGFGNYSVRQYEVLSLGKIPVYIDTGAKLPFEDEIDYHELFIIVPFDKIHNISHYIDVYVAKNKNRFPEIQKKIRAIYEEYFIMKNYYTKIITSLSKK